LAAMRYVPEETQIALQDILLQIININPKTWMTTTSFVF
jgi:hypothetical protein